MYQRRTDILAMMARSGEAVFFESFISENNKMIMVG
jgi:hypothetical protein